MSSLKIAFCFSGMIRDLKKTEYFWKQIFDNHNCDIYGHFWDVSDRSEEDNLSNFEKYFHPKNYIKNIIYISNYYYISYYYFLLNRIL